MSIDSRIYRIIYNIIVTICFLFVLILVPSLSDLLLIEYQFDLRLVISIGIFLIGAIISGWGLMNWNLSSFLGLEKESDTLRTNGPYRISRHPVYTGIILIFISLAIMHWSTTTVSWLLGAGGYFVLGTVPEEQKLSAAFETYDEYKSKVGRLFPVTIRNWKYLMGIV